jgi:O-antigen/teichoic acid export membrane protein
MTHDSGGNWRGRKPWRGRTQDRDNPEEEKQRFSPISALREFALTLRRDRLYRTSVLLVADGLFLSAFGGLFLLIATHVWEPRSIGVVAAVFGAAALLESIAFFGMPAMIIANLAKEPDQELMTRGALVVSVSAGITFLAFIWIVPGHFGVPLSKLGTSSPIAVVLTMILVVGVIIATVIDATFLARQEVSWKVGKDVVAVVVRFIALALLVGSGTEGYLGVAVIYTATAAILDLVVFRRRLTRMPRPRASLGLGVVRSHARFAAGSQISVLVSTIPTSLLPLIVLARLGQAAAAYTAIPMTVIGFLTVFSSSVANSLFAELAAHPETFFEPVRKALKWAYLVTLPIAVVLIVAAPRLLQFFGHGYSANGRDLLRWGAASSIFFCLNYVSDIILLARKYVGAYVAANVIGSVFVLVSLLVGVRHGLGGLGFAWFIGQACYCTVSCTILVWHVGRRDLLPVLRQMWG